ncbi:MAG: ubiquinol-cytochrome c reductase cytochrome b subunit [Acidimicrobiia bacterium]|nr:ubiquinol-cytochrome c reductase cytochrome b subunit [Acidimicrobiia bacterium]
MIKRLLVALDNRLNAASFTRRTLTKVFPDHWSFMLGEIALYAFLMLVLTGVFLTFFFDASQATTTYNGTYQPLNGVEVSQAFRSVLDISFDVRAGLVMRQAHHWAALIFVAAIIVHLCRIFFTGAFRKPRDINWVVGVTLLLLAIFNGFTGYSLPDDLLSGIGLRVLYSIALSIPLVGTWLAYLVFGGEFPAEGIISRLYSIHIMIIPLTIGAILTIHLALVWHQKHAQFKGPGRTESNVVGSRLWPTYAVKSVGLFFMVAAVIMALGGLFQINPVWFFGPFDPAQVTSPAQPDWYMGWMEGALRLFPPWEIGAFDHVIVPAPFFPAVLLPGITFAFLYAWPFLEAWLTGDHDAHNLLDRPRDRPIRTSLGVATLGFYIMLLVAGSNDLIAKWLLVNVGAVTNVLRVLLFVVPVFAGLLTFSLLRGLVASGARRLTDMPASAVWQSWKRDN